MRTFLCLFLPSGRSNLFGGPKPISERNRWKDPDIRGPLPDVRIDFAGRTPLTRPSSARPASGDNVGLKCSLGTLPLEIRQQIWEEVMDGGRTFHLVMVGGRTFDLVMVERQLRAPECLSSDPGHCNGGCRRLYGPGVVKSPKKFLLPLLLTCRQM